MLTLKSFVQVNTKQPTILRDTPQITAPGLSTSGRCWHPGSPPNLHTPRKLSHRHGGSATPGFAQIACTAPARAHVSGGSPVGAWVGRASGLLSAPDFPHRSTWTSTCGLRRRHRTHTGGLRCPPSPGISALRKLRRAVRWVLLEAQKRSSSLLYHTATVPTPRRVMRALWQRRRRTFFV